MSTIVETVGSVFSNFWQAIVEHLPGSPFRYFIDEVANLPYLSYLNWFFPVSECIVVLEAWLAVITIFYTYSAILRFIRLIK